MGKFICLCGVTFKKQKDSDLHQKMYEDLDFMKGYPSHKIFKQHWQARLLEWFFNYKWGRIFRFAGVFMVYSVLMNHFKVDLSIVEAGLIGLGMGMAI